MRFTHIAVVSSLGLTFALASCDDGSSVKTTQNGGNGGSPNVPHVAAGQAHTCVLLDTGAMRCWGAGAFGKLGHDAPDNIGDGVGDSIVAAGDVPVGGSVAQVVAGGDHTCALLDTGATRCWGRGTFGRLGHDATDNIGDGVGDSIIATGDVPVGGTVAQISVSDGHSCALLDTGAVRCWGLGSEGRLGNGATDNIGDGVGDSIIAAGDVSAGGTVTQIAAGSSHTCALLDTGAVRCWGIGANGRLGHDATDNIGDGVGDSIVAAGDVPVGGTVTQIAAGGPHTCALLDTGAVRCWGSGSVGKLGYDAADNIGDGVGDSIVAAGDVPVGGSVAQIAAGGSHTCALLDTGAVRCWGWGSSGQLGHGATANIGDGVGDSIIAAGDVPVGGTVTQIAAGNAYTCALLDTGAVRCWGDGGSGRLGYDAMASIGDGTGDSIIEAGDVPVE